MSESGWYITTYPVHENPPYGTQAGCYGSNLWAPDLKTAYELIEARRCGETIISAPCRKPHSHPELSKKIRRKKPWKTVLHAACFTCWHASKAGVITPDEALGDAGLIHGIVHAMNFRASKEDRECLAILAEDVESRIPGWLEE